MSLYESGGKFSNCSVPISEYERCRKERDKAREFIWHHLKDKKRAYIAYQWTGVDTGADYHIFIEPDENGRWIIVLRDTGDLRYQLPVKEDKAYFAKYKRATDDDSYPFENGERFLLLLDENGKEVDSL